jgi:hypothetical protein
MKSSGCGDSKRNRKALQHEIGDRIPFSRTVSAFNAIIELSSQVYSYPAISPSWVSEDKTQELEIYSGSYPVRHNDAAESMLCNECGIGRQPTCFCYRRQEAINSDQAFVTTHQRGVAMLPHMGPEFVEALRSRATNRPATDTPRAISQSPYACKRLDRLAPFQRVTLLFLSRILAVVTSKWMIYLILIC